MQILKAGALYFALVFAAGFVLGPIRILLLVPRFGERTAELLEQPVMLVVMIFAARWVVGRLAVPPKPSARLGMGVVALVFLLLIEFTVVLWIQGLTIGDYVAGRDPVAGGVYAFMLLVFAAMPLLAARQ